MKNVTMLGVAVAAALALTVSGCGDDEDDATVGNEGSAEDQTVEVTAVDYEFRGLPDTVDVGTELRLVN